MKPREIKIIGGGASGAMLAIRLLRHGSADVQVDLVDPSPRLGRGVAYGTTDVDHLLNVPAIGMSAFTEQPDHFQRWAGCQPGDFLARQRFGEYLESLVETTSHTTSATLIHHRRRATRLVRSDDGIIVVLEDGTSLQPGSVVVATGLESPYIPRELRTLVGQPNFITNPWAPRPSTGEFQGAHIAIIGSGLTGVDVALSVLQRNLTAEVTMISRHGQLPKRHENPWRPRLDPPIFRVEKFLQQDEPCEFAQTSILEDPEDWRRRLDSLRPITQEVWIKMSPTTRETFHKKYRHLWDSHRHRMSADIGDRCERLMLEGRLRVVASEIVETRQMPDQISLRVDDEGTIRDIAVDLVILATGPDPDPAANPLLANAINNGLARAGLGGVGVDTEHATARIVDRSGEPQPQLYAMGPLRRGTLWESMAIPEIRAQADDLAERLLA